MDEAVAALKKVVPESEWGNHGASDDPDSTLKRFLQARDCNVQKAADMLLACNKFRAKTLNFPLHEAECKYLKFAGRDVGGRPIIVFNGEVFGDATDYAPKLPPTPPASPDSAAAKSPSRKEEKKRAREAGVAVCVKHLVALIETVINMSPDACNQSFVLVTWFGAKSSASAANKELLKVLVSNLSDNYPERLHKVLVGPATVLARTLWGVVKLFMNPVTRKKVLIAKEGDPAFLEVMDATCIPVQFGGKRTWVECEQLTKALFATVSSNLPAVHSPMGLMREGFEDKEHNILQGIV